MTSKTCLAAIVCFAAGSTVALAQPAALELAPRQHSVAAAPKAQPKKVVRGLPASAPDLRLEGEHVVREWPVQLTGAEVVGARTFRLTFRNAVSNLPEASSVSVRVNDVVVGEVRLDAFEGPKTVEIAVPAGLLVDGLNAVRLVVNQRHRVDCSLAATYELWTAIDPADTGFVLPSEGLIRRPAELIRLAGGTQGNTKLRVLRIEGSDAASVEQSLRAAQAIAVLTRMPKPSTTFASVPGTGPGIDIAVGSAATLAAMGFTDKNRVTLMPGVSVSRAEDGRTTVFVTSDTGSGLDPILTELEAAADSFVPTGHPAGLRAWDGATGTRVEPGRSYSLTELGGEPAVFDGRRFVSALRVVLPADFYPGGYAKARLMLNGSYAGGLRSSNAITVRVNGVVVSNAGYLRTGGGVFNDYPVELPYTAFKSGANIVSIEGELSTAADETCDRTRPDRGVRLVVGADTYLTFDRFAQAVNLPNIGATTAFGVPLPGASEPVRLKVSPGDPRYLDGAGSLLVRAAMQGRKVIPFRFDFGTPNPMDLSTVYVGPAVAAAAAPITRPSTAAAVGGDGPGATSNGAEKAPVRAAILDLATLNEAATMVTSHVGRIIGDIVDRVLLTRIPIDRSVPAGGLAVIQTAEAPVGWSKERLFWDSLRGGAQQPRVLTEVTAQDAETFAVTLQKALDGDAWDRLDGASAVVWSETGKAEVRSSGGQLLVASGSFSLMNIRLVTAGWLTRNNGIYLGLVLASAVLLGISTYASVRRRKS